MAATAAPSTTAPLPAGQVTFVMTDIEGSTRLFHEQGSAYPELLDVHQRLLQSAFGAHHGVDVETEGDALIVAFTDAADALAGCLDGQLALAAHRWPPGAAIRVRFGVHTGEATPVDGRYVSLALHQVARICASAHGEQILMSAATAAATDGRLPDGAGLTGLGSFQLRGFPNPEILYQLRHPGLRDDFPPLRALGVVEHNLPYFRSSFVGRLHDRAVVADLTRTAGVVSVVGLGGVGKTRLAVQVAFDVMEDFDDGAWLVELAPLRDAAAVPGVVAAAVRVAEAPGRSIEDTLVEALTPKTLLLLIDNCEHLVDAVATLVERLTRSCPNLVVLATTREPLDVEGEAVWWVEPLPTGQADDGVDAVRLFADRARMVRPEFHLTDDNAAVVAEIVVHLNGIPLAIELAAATLADRPLADVRDGLTDRFALLSHGRRTAPERHQTLRAALEWSLDLLPAEVRRLFSRLAAFAGSGTIEAVTEVCAESPSDADSIQGSMRRLGRASLVAPHPEVAGRWSMLESMRELAALELRAAGEADRLAARHRDWFTRRVEETGDSVGLRSRGAVMVDLAMEHDNIRLALDTAVTAGDEDRARRIGAAMTPFWTSHGDWTEGIDRLSVALAMPGGQPGIRGRALIAAGSLLLLRGDLDEAAQRLEEGRRLVSAAGDEVAWARALSGLGYVAFRHSRLEQARVAWEEALAHAEAAGDERVAAGILRSLAIAAASSGDQDLAGQLIDRAITAAQQAGDDQMLRLLLGSSAERHLWLGHYRVAAEAYGQALDLASVIGDLSARPLLLAELGWVALLEGDIATAHRLATEAAELAEDIGNRRVLAHALRLTGEALVRQGEILDAAGAFERGLAVAESLGAPAEVAGLRCSQACLALDDGRLDEARSRAEEAIALSPLPHAMRRISSEWVVAMVDRGLGDLEAAAGRFREAVERAVRAQLPRHEANGVWGLAVVEAATGRIGAAAEHHAAALATRHTIGDRLGIVESLVGAAELGAPVDPTTAARVLAAAMAILERRSVKATRREAAAVVAAEQAVATADPSRRVGSPTWQDVMDEDAAVEAAGQLLRRVSGDRSDEDGAGRDTRIDDDTEG